MRERLLAYLLNDLDPAERAAVESELAADPDLQQELEKLRECLAAGGADCGAEEVPPPKLALRTCSFVNHAIHKSKTLCGHGSSVRLSENRDPLVNSNRWSLLDVGAAVCVAIALGALVAPSLQSARTDARLLKCQDNLHGIGAAMMEVAIRHNEALPEIKPGENAGIWVIWLTERGVSSAELVDLLVCPDSELAERVNRGCVNMQIPTREEYLAAQGAERERMRRYMAGDYAFSMGHRDPQNQLRQVRFSGNREIPLSADSPSPAIAGYQSANHRGGGQNVLYQDLSVKFLRHCKCQQKRDHLYLNDEGQPAAGCHEDDIVLGSSDATPVLELISTK